MHQVKNVTHFLKTNLVFVFMLLYILFLLTSIRSYGQNWERNFGGTVNEEGYAVQQINDGSFIVVGSSSSFGAGSNDVYLVKVDINGNLVWSKTFGGIYTDVGNSVSQTRDGGFIVAGETSSFGAGDEDIYLIKTDVNGDTSWTRTYGTSDQEFNGSAIQTSDNGYCIVGGTQTGFLTDILVIKTDSSGNVAWTKNYGKSILDYGYSIQQTADDGFIISGATYDSIQLQYDIFIVRTDELGDTLWTKTISENESAYGNSVAVCIDNGFIVSGTANENFYAVKLDSLGNIQWTKEVTEIDAGGLDRCSSVIQAADGGFVLGGYKHNFGTTDPDAMIVKLDINGNFLWSRKFGGTQQDEGAMVRPVAGGGFIITGKSSSFGNGWQLYLVKTDCENFPSVAINAGDTTCQANLLSVELLSTTNSGINYQWFLNDTAITVAIASTLSVTGPGFYNLMVSDSNGCSNESNDIGISLPRPAFNAYPGEVCVGDSVLMGWDLWQTNYYSTYVWDFGDGTVDTAVTASHSYQNTGTYAVTRSVLTVNGTCHEYVDSVRVTTTAVPPVDFDLLVNSRNMFPNIACPGDVIDFIPFAYSFLFVPLPPFLGASYHWDFGDGTTSSDLHTSHVYTQYGLYAITFTVTNHCGISNSISDTVTIDSLAGTNSYFMWTDSSGVTNGDVNACEPLTFSSAGGSTYQWNFGDGSTPNVSNDTIIHSFGAAGNYLVQVIATNGCGSTHSFSDSIEVSGTCTGIQDIGNRHRVKVYPNPFVNSFMVEMENLPAFAEITLYDLLGRIELKEKISSKTTEVFAEHLTQGLYFYTITDRNEKIASGKIIAE